MTFPKVLHDHLYEDTSTAVEEGLALDKLMHSPASNSEIDDRVSSPSYFDMG